jgi:hypothetical protein
MNVEGGNAVSLNLLSIEYFLRTKEFPPSTFYTCLPAGRFVCSAVLLFFQIAADDIHL